MESQECCTTLHQNHQEQPNGNNQIYFGISCHHQYYTSVVLCVVINYLFWNQLFYFSVLYESLKQYIELIIKAHRVRICSYQISIFLLLKFVNFSKSWHQYFNNTWHQIHFSTHKFSLLIHEFRLSNAESVWLSLKAFDQV